MALPTAKLSELPFHHGALPLCSRPSLSLSLLRCRFRLLFSASASASLRLAERSGDGSGDSDARRTPKTRKYPWDDDAAGRNPNPRSPTAPHDSRAPSAPWLQQWTSPDPRPATPPPPPPERRTATAGGLGKTDAGGGSIERIVHRLRNLGLGLEEDEEVGSSKEAPPLDGGERLGDLLERSWNRPDFSGPDRALLPWEREWDSGFMEGGENEGLKKRRVKAPTLAELTIEDLELRRLRRQGMTLRERITIPKAGVTQAIAEKIHDAWRKSELVRLKFHEALAHDMRMAHELVEVGMSDVTIQFKILENSNLNI